MKGDSRWVARTEKSWCEIALWRTVALRDLHVGTPLKIGVENDRMIIDDRRRGVSVIL